MTNETVEENIVLPYESMYKSIDKVVKEHGFLKYDVKISAGAKKGDNYIGIVYRIHVSAEKKNGEEGKFNLFCKVSPQNEARRQHFKSRNAFLREALIYEDILPAFLKFQEKKGITEGGFEAYAKCYEASNVEKEEYLLMEDLRDDNFVMFDRREVLDFEHAKIVLEELGKLHALSMAMKDQETDTFKKLSKLDESLFRKPAKDNMPVQMIRTLLSKSTKFLDVEDVQVINKFKDNFVDLLYDTVDNNLAEPYTVICHGDCWITNMLYKYENGAPVKTCLLDWQISRYGSPVLDLMFFIFVCTEKTLRDEHYDDLLRVYHGSLSKFLTRLGSDPEKLFPYSALQDQLKKFGKYGFFIGLMFVNAMVSTAEDVQDLDEQSDSIKDMDGENANIFKHSEETDRRYQKRVKDIFKDMLSEIHKSKAKYIPTITKPQPSSTIQYYIPATQKQSRDRLHIN